MKPESSSASVADAADLRTARPDARTVKRVVATSIVVTALHYTDNFINIAAYPSPDWIHRETVYLAWSLLTLVGVAGYLFVREGRDVAAGVYLGVYSVTGLSSIAHYLHGPLSAFSTKMHLLVWADGAVGALVLRYAVRILIAREEPPPGRGFGTT